jgi:hypothetical protein
MSRIFRAHHTYHPYDPYLHEELNQIARHYLPIANCNESKDGKARKDHVIQTFWYKSKPTIVHYLLLSASSKGGIISL